MAEILVAVDGSARSNRIVEFSCELARQMSSSILLLYVGKTEPEPEGVRDFARAEHLRDAYATYLQDVGNSVTSKLREEIEKQHVPFRALVEFGDPAKTILALADSSQAKMIVVGLTGLHNIGLLRSLGSVARRVVENAKCPVVVVP